VYGVAANKLHLQIKKGNTDDPFPDAEFCAPKCPDAGKVLSGRFSFRKEFKASYKTSGIIQKADN
jgi:hypothetical protein